MAKSAKPNANGYVLPPEKMKQREKAFQLYRDLGPTRSIHQLVALLAQDYPELAASRTTIDKWSRMHDWQKRVKAHDDAVRRTPPQAATPAAPVSQDFDQIDALLKAANQALTRAMSAAPVVTDQFRKPATEAILWPASEQNGALRLPYNAVAAMPSRLKRSSAHTSSRSNSRRAAPANIAASCFRFLVNCRGYTVRSLKRNLPPWGLA